MLSSHEQYPHTMIGTFSAYLHFVVRELDRFRMSCKHNIGNRAERFVMNRGVCIFIKIKHFLLSEEIATGLPLIYEWLFKGRIDRFRVNGI